ISFINFPRRHLLAATATDGASGARSAEGNAASQRLFPQQAGADQFRGALSSCRRTLATVRTFRTARKPGRPTNRRGGDEEEVTRPRYSRVRDKPSVCDGDGERDLAGALNLWGEIA